MQSTNFKALRLRPLASAVLLALSAGTAWGQSTALPEVSVTGTREKELIVETPASIGVISGETIKLDRPNHPSQIMSQIPGVAVAVTNGEGHTTSIRQPFTTGPVYLFLEDGIPSRSTGFFNHNALYELNIPQAGGIEVIRGPGTALHGSDAIGGIINILTRTPPPKGEFSAFGEIGGHGWHRLLLGGGNAHGDDAWRADLNLSHTDGWRAKSAYDRQSGTFRWDRALGSSATLKTVVSFSRVEQETGANSPLSRADYGSNPTRNYLPIAFRRVNALRISSAWEREMGGSLLSITPYFRDNSMDLLASFNLNNDPTISYGENRSYGVQAKWRHDFGGSLRGRLVAGADMEVSPGGRQEDAIRTVTSNVGVGTLRNHTAYTTLGRIYNYHVTYRGFSPYVHGEISPTDRLRLQAGLRYDRVGYSFDNGLGGAVTVAAAAGTFPTGTRIYGQAPDSSVRYRHASPKFGATFALTRDHHLFVSRNHGFRAPSEGDLFRPSFVSTTAAQAQAVAAATLALKPIKADQVEFGARGKAGPVSYDVVLFDLKKRDDIVSQRDTSITGLPSVRVNAGMTRHKGIEIGAGVAIGAGFRLDTALSHSKQTYVDWISSTATAVTALSGKEIESAPRTMANTRLTWNPDARARLQLEWVRIGSYWQDAANTARYEGHDLVNLRANWDVNPSLALYASVHNLGDKRYSDSSSISSGVQVYSPGLPRTLYAGIEGKW